MTTKADPELVLNVVSSRLNPFMICELAQVSSYLNKCCNEVKDKQQKNPKKYIGEWEQCPLCFETKCNKKCPARAQYIYPRKLSMSDLKYTYKLTKKELEGFDFSCSVSRYDRITQYYYDKMQIQRYIIAKYKTPEEFERKMKCKFSKAYRERETKCEQWRIKLNEKDDIRWEICAEQFLRNGKGGKTKILKQLIRYDAYIKILNEEFALYEFDKSFVSPLYALDLPEESFEKDLREKINKEQEKYRQKKERREWLEKIYKNLDFDLNDLNGPGIMNLYINTGWNKTNIQIRIEHMFMTLKTNFYEIHNTNINDYFNDQEQNGYLYLEDHIDIMRKERKRILEISKKAAIKQFINQNENGKEKVPDFIMNKYFN